MSDVQTILQGLTVVLASIDTAVLVVLARAIIRDSAETRLARAENARIRAALTK